MTTATQRGAPAPERLRMPDGRQMTEQEWRLQQQERAAVRGRLVRAMLAVLVMGAGLGIAVGGAWLYDWRAGLIVLGVSVTLVGALLGYLGQ